MSMVFFFIDVYDFGFVGLHLAPLLSPSHLVVASVQLTENQ